LMRLPCPAASKNIWRYFCEAGVEMWKTQSPKIANEFDLNRSLTTQ
jgi:hypothetical protein